MGDEAIHVSLSKDEKQEIRVEAARRDMSMSEFGREILSDWLDENTAKAEN